MCKPPPSKVSPFTTYTYGIFGELQTITLEDNTLIEYKHNANHQRVAKLINGEVVKKYLWLNLTTLLATYDKDDNLITRYEYTSDRVPEIMTHNKEIYHLLYNHQGSLRAVVDQEGTPIKELQYDSFGIITLDTNPDFEIEFGFAGGLYDKDTKLTRFGYRDYDAHTGKWTAKDPIGFSGGDTNLYGYVLQDPVNFVDPWGLNPLIAIPAALLWLDSYLNAPEDQDNVYDGLTPNNELGMCLVGGNALKPLNFYGPKSGRQFQMSYNKEPFFRWDKHNLSNYTGHKNPVNHYHRWPDMKKHRPFEGW